MLDMPDNYDRISQMSGRAQKFFMVDHSQPAESMKLDRTHPPAIFSEISEMMNYFLSSPLFGSVGTDRWTEIGTINGSRSASR